MSPTSAQKLPSSDEKDIFESPAVESADRTGDITVETHKVKLSEIDDAAELVAGFHGEVTEEQSRRVRRKIDLHLLPLMLVAYRAQHCLEGD